MWPKLLSGDHFFQEEDYKVQHVVHIELDILKACIYGTPLCGTCVHIHSKAARWPSLWPSESHMEKQRRFLQQLSAVEDLYFSILDFSRSLAVKAPH